MVRKWYLANEVLKTRGFPNRSALWKKPLFQGRGETFIDSQDELAQIAELTRRIAKITAHNYLCSVQLLLRVQAQEKQVILALIFFLATICSKA